MKLARRLRRALLATPLLVVLLALGGPACRSDAEPDEAGGEATRTGGAERSDGERPAPEAAAPPSWQAPGMPMEERLTTLLREAREDVRRGGGGPLFDHNGARADWLRGRLEAEEDPQRAARLRARLGVELLRAGRPEEAGEALDAALEHYRDDGDERRYLRIQRAAADLQRGEQDNCIHHRRPGSCLFPIRDDGVHALPEGARAAAERFAAILEDHPDDPAVRWWLHVARSLVGEEVAEDQAALPGDLLAAEQPFPAFRNVAREADAAVRRRLGGVVTDDFDGDDLVDVVVTSWGPDEPIRLLLNDGDGTFSDRTAEAGLEALGGGNAVTQADYDGDGDLDLYVARGTWRVAGGRWPDSLLRNDGGATFTDVTEAAGLLSFAPTSTAAWGDYDGDGDVDLFVGHEATDERTRRVLVDLHEGPDGGVPEVRAPSRLYRNDGDGTFTDVTEAEGLDEEAFVKGATWGDYDGDGRLDLYVSHLLTPGRLLRNAGPDAEGPRFRDVTGSAGLPDGGLAGRLSPVPESSPGFATWFWDYDNDGHLDLFVAEVLVSLNHYRTPFSEHPAEALFMPPPNAPMTDGIRLLVQGLSGEGTGWLEGARAFHNEGGGRFRPVAEDLGLDRVLGVMGANHGDLDGDGFDDVYLGTGEPRVLALMPNRMLRNDAGRRFADVTAAARMGHLQKGHGIGMADFDNDGDLDVFLNAGGAFEADSLPSALFANPGSDHRRVTLVLEGTDSSRDALHAGIRVRVRDASGETRDVHTMVSGGSSFGGSALRRTIGLGDAEAVESVRVRWPSGLEQDVEGVELDRFYRLKEGGEPEAFDPPRFSL